MSAIDRKAAIDAYKRRKVIGGVYAVSCEPTGERWVGAANDLSTIKNRIWFSLGQGNAPWAVQQKAWKMHGEDRFTFAELERLPDDLEPYAREVRLKERLAHWLTELGASTI
jgi:hypothetical protein